MLAAVALTSCIEDDFTTSSSDTLEFSVDTLAFDTVLTEEGTATRRFTVYNRHKKMLNISSITLDGNTGGRFYVNVDGVSGSSFSNVMSSSLLAGCPKIILYDYPYIVR